MRYFPSQMVAVAESVVVYARERGTEFSVDVNIVVNSLLVVLVEMLVVFWSYLKDVTPYISIYRLLSSGEYNFQLL